jgi:recombination protein RecT
MKMAKTNEELMDKLQGAPMVKAPSTIAGQVAGYLDKMKGQLAHALPKHITPDRMARVALTEIRTNPKLLECSMESLMACVMKAAQEGLEFGTGDAYLVPFFNNKNKKMEAQYIRGYRGSLKLIRRSQEIASIGAYPVYSKDIFDLELGTTPKVTHKPNLMVNRGELVGFYCAAEIKGQGHYIEWMSIEEVEAIKTRSKAKDYGPWITDFIEMGRKTVLKRASKYLPMAIEAATAIEEDNRTEFGEDVSEMNLGELPQPKPVEQIEHQEEQKEAA